MPCYDYIGGALKEVKSIYDKVGGVLREVDTGYDYINGALREYHSNGIPLYDAPIGSRILHDGMGYTLVGKDYNSISGNVVLWSETAGNQMLGVYLTLDSEREKLVTQSTPFGENNTHVMPVTYTVIGSLSKGSFEGYGWTISEDTLREIPYLYALEDGSCYPNIGRDTEWYTGDIYYNNSGGGGNLFYVVTTEGRIRTAQLEVSMPEYIDIYYAYSVNGQIKCKQNSDGDYVLKL